MNTLWIVECDGNSFVIPAATRDDAIRLCEKTFGPAERTLSVCEASGSIGVNYREKGEAMRVEKVSKGEVKVELDVSTKRLVVHRGRPATDAERSEDKSADSMEEVVTIEYDNLGGEPRVTVNRDLCSKD